MKVKREFPCCTVSRKAEAQLRNGHPWVYDTEIQSIDEGIENGSLVDVMTDKGVYMGTGLLSMTSKIRVRILSKDANEKFGDEFYLRRMGYAIDYRMNVMRDDMQCIRLVFGEADGLPGITVDRYENTLVTQVLSYGMEKIKDRIYAALKEALDQRGFRVDGIYERNDVAVRELEGLTVSKGWYGDASNTEITIKENGISYIVDIENGQKTGFFLDQKYNRKRTADIACGKNVLDCFTHTGSFALNAVKGGAASVTAVDISETALNTARRNAELNGMKDKVEFVKADVFDLLVSLREAHTKYEYIILDPPAFTKSRKTIEGASRGYKEINYEAIKLLGRGGYLATCSCSHFMGSELFLKNVSEAARDAGVMLKLIEARRQSPDHPVLLNVPETDYLKFYIFQIC